RNDYGKLTFGMGTQLTIKP
uniref:Uncharacterized protein n=1 Tax=Sarcophilus harrisii TaxID=9305 RepID=A0A7N4P5A6_SARHA